MNLNNIQKQINSTLHNKCDTAMILELFSNSEMFSQYSNEIQEAIDTYNIFRESPQNININADILHNSNHLQTILLSELPLYSDIIINLDTNKKLLELVFSELSNSSYFSEIYNIENPKHLLINLLILFYRTSLLHLNPELRKKGAQISSVLEEMAVINEYSGSKTELFQAIKHWVLNWKEEEFSEELANIISI